MITVVNVKQQAADIYIGRTSRGRAGSALGNPFVIGKDGDRAEVLSKYRVWLMERVSQRDPNVLDALHAIQAAAEQGDVTLGCWCAPQACHGQDIANLLQTDWGIDVLGANDV